MKKNIIICYDGTGNEYGANNTNVVKTFEAIIRDETQAAFYDPGVGTFSFLGRTLGKHVGILMGKAFGTGLQQNIEDGYEYLMDRYIPGDDVFMFGFSRGAFTVRALAGMIYKFGILQKGSNNLIPYVSKMYNNRDFSLAKEFKSTFSHGCKPLFIGVWDTVGSLGYFYGKKFFDQKLNHDVKYGFQAVAIDEKRKKFPVNLWDEGEKSAEQEIEQVWFAGVHSDIGGFFEERGLSDISFAWMMDKAGERGLKLKDNWQSNLKQNACGPIHESRKGFWKLWPPVKRKMPHGAKIHESVRMRMAECEYDPGLPVEHILVNNKSY